MPYEFKEFPKWVALSGHKPILCEDAEEESALRAAHVAKASVEREANALVAGFRVGDAVTGFPDGPHTIVDVLPKKAGWPKGKKRGPRTLSVN